MQSHAPLDPHRQAHLAAGRGGRLPALQQDERRIGPNPAARLVALEHQPIHAQRLADAGFRQADRLQQHPASPVAQAAHPLLQVRVLAPGQQNRAQPIRRIQKKREDRATVAAELDAEGAAGELLQAGEAGAGDGGVAVVFEVPETQSPGPASGDGRRRVRAAGRREYEDVEMLHSASPSEDDHPALRETRFLDPPWTP